MSEMTGLQKLMLMTLKYSLPVIVVLFSLHLLMVGKFLGVLFWCAAFGFVYLLYNWLQNPEKVPELLRTALSADM